MLLQSQWFFLEVLFCWKLCFSASGILCEFLQVAIHGILYVHELYPLGAFERKRKYNVPIQASTELRWHRMKQFVQAIDWI
jgi:hypothetical protein